MSARCSRRVHASDEVDEESPPLLSTEEAPDDQSHQSWRPYSHIALMATVMLALALVVTVVVTKSNKNWMERQVSLETTKDWSIGGHATVENSGDNFVLGDHNFESKTTETVNANSTRYFTVAGKKCEGSGNGVNGAAAQVVCCYGQDVQCCGEAAATAAKAVQNHEATKVSGGKVAIGSGCKAFQRTLDDTYVKDHAKVVNKRGCQSIGNGNIIKCTNTVQNDPGEDDMMADALAKLGKFARRKSYFNETRNAVLWLHRKGYAKDVQHPLFEGGTTTAFELAFYMSNNYAAAELLCNYGMTQPSEEASCKIASRKAKQGLIKPKDAGDWITLGLKGGGTAWGKKWSMNACYIRALELDPKNANAWNQVGTLLGAEVQGKTYSRKECMEKAVEFDPTVGSFWNNLGAEGGGEVHGKTYSEKGCLLKAVELDPGDASFWSGLGVLGGGEVHDKSYSGKECLLKAIKLDPTFALLWRNLGMSGGGEVNGTNYSPIECLLKALKLAPRDALLWWDFGDAGGGEMDGKSYTTKECYAKAVEISPSATHWGGLGTVGGGVVHGKDYSPKQCYEKSLEFPAVATKKGSHVYLGNSDVRTLSTTWNNLGSVGGGMIHGQSYSKKDCFAKAAEVDPTNPKPWDNLGKYGGGEVNGKIYSKKECFLKSLHLNFKDPITWKHLAEVGGGKVNGKVYSKNDCLNAVCCLSGYVYMDGANKVCSPCT